MKCEILESILQRINVLSIFSPYSYHFGQTVDLTFGIFVIHQLLIMFLHDSHDRLDFNLGKLEFNQCRIHTYLSHQR